MSPLDPAKVLARAAKADTFANSGKELEYTLFNENPKRAAAKGYRNFAPATQHASHDPILYQAAGTEWCDAVAAICDPLRVDLAKMHAEIGAGFGEACMGAGKGLEPTDQLMLLKTCLRALTLRQGNW